MSKKQKTKNLHTLIPLEDFKALTGVDDREDKVARFCLVTATLAIEQYCMRSFLRKKKTEIVDCSRENVIPLSEYPVSEVIAVYGINSQQEKYIEPQFYRCMFGCDFNEDLPFSLLLSSSLRFYQFVAVKIIYWSGYKAGDVPADLASACLELAAWNMNRYRGRRIGVTGNKDERVDWLIPVFTRTGRSLVTRRLYRSQKLLAFFINILYYFR